MLEISPVVLGLVPIVIALVQGFKEIGFNSKLNFFFSLAVSIVLAWVVIPTEPISTIVIGGLVLGLSSSGLYSGGKKLLQ